MHLPISISNLLHNSVVESDRIEFKADWNPESVLHTICAFATDFHNFGGGYIVLGIEELIELTATVPFDDRLNHHATLQDIKLPLIQSFLKEVGSKLLAESHSMQLPDLCRQMAIVDGANEYLKPRNFGLLFFNDQPDRFFPYAQIDVVYFPDDEDGNTIQEEIFKGPLDHQLRSALRHIRNGFISERILKIPGQAEARHIFNYPYDAIEEALVNAVYHRGYDIREPIEVRINRNSISVVSHPGPDPSIKLENVKTGQMVSRRYRNRRIGEMLKELDFTEGRGTGVPKIQNACKANGSPEPTFFTDDGRLSFWTTIHIHPEFLNKRVPAMTQKATVEATVNQTEIRILQLCIHEPASRKDILTHLGHKTFSGNTQLALRHLREMGLIIGVILDKPSSKNQRYKLTKAGEKFLKTYGIDKGG